MPNKLEICMECGRFYGKNFIEHFHLTKKEDCDWAAHAFENEWDDYREDDEEEWKFIANLIPHLSNAFPEKEGDSKLILKGLAREIYLNICYDCLEAAMLLRDAELYLIKPYIKEEAGDVSSEEEEEVGVAGGSKTASKERNILIS